jgi:arsenical resistance protein ArsH
MAASESTSLTPGGSKNGNASININGDLNNLSSMRVVAPPTRDPAFAYLSLAIPASEDDARVRSEYRTFLLSEEAQQTDWVSKLELATATEMASRDLQTTGERLKVLVLYGSLRSR